MWAISIPNTSIVRPCKRVEIFSIGDADPTKFAKVMILGWHWPQGCGTLIFSYIRRPWLLLGFKIWNFNILVFFFLQKNEYFWGYEEIVDITNLDNWGGRGSFLYILRLFLVSRYRMEIFFGGRYNFQIFNGVWLNSWYFFLVNSRCWVQAYVSRKNESIPTMGIGPLYGNVKYVLMAFMKNMGKTLKHLIL